jgi:hypothetical protein
MSSRLCNVPLKNRSADLVGDELPPDALLPLLLLFLFAAKKRDLLVLF